MNASSRRPILACLAALVATTACTSIQPEPGKPDIAAAESGACRADAVQWAIGQQASQETTGRVWRESHAGLIRPISPGQAVTRDYRADRVNIELDADNRITRVYCG